MAQVTIRDTSLWTKHIAGGPKLKKKLESLSEGERVWLRIDGQRGCFEKMKAMPDGRPMPGLKPVEETREWWRQIFPARAGEVVEISLDEDPGAAPPEAPPQSDWGAASRAERDAAWEAFKALSAAGWRSEKKSGNRDELHER